MTVYFISRWDCFEYVIKNCDPFVSGPWLAMETTPLTLCCGVYRENREITSWNYLRSVLCSTFNPSGGKIPPRVDSGYRAKQETFSVSWNSSANFPPQMLLPPFPVPVGSPVCTMKSLMFLWRHKNLL